MKSIRFLLAAAMTLVATRFAVAAEPPKNCGCSCCVGEEVCCCNRAKAVTHPAETTREIRSVLMEQFDRPDYPLVLILIVVQADYAIADWHQADTGGRVLLQHVRGHWHPVLCAGAALKGSDALKRAGMDAASAKILAEKLHKAEAALTDAQRAKLDSAA